MKKTLFLLCPLAMALLFASCAGGPIQSERPSYLQSLSDLRLAADYLNGTAPAANLDQRITTGILEIDRAIAEIKRVAEEEDKNLQNEPPVDAKINPQGRFENALRLLKAARKDLRGGEPNPDANSHRKLALTHVNNALVILLDYMKNTVPAAEVTPEE